MRDIKFRCWFPKGTDTCNGEIKKGEMCYDVAFENYEPINDLLEGVEHLMQFTGIYDKNKKPIYESDIVKFFESGLFKIVWAYSCWRGENSKISPQTLPIPNFSQMEVIGNIWENPDLLRSKQ